MPSKVDVLISRLRAGIAFWIEIFLALGDAIVIFFASDRPRLRADVAFWIDEPHARIERVRNHPHP